MDYKKLKTASKCNLLTVLNGLSACKQEAPFNIFQYYAKISDITNTRQLKNILKIQNLITVTPQTWSHQWFKKKL